MLLGKRFDKTLAKYYVNCLCTLPPPPTVNHGLTCYHYKEGEERGKAVKIYIGVGSLVTAKVGDMEKNTVKGERRRVSKDLVQFVHVSQ